MKVHEAMTREVMVAAPGETLAHAAKVMADSDIGFLPVAENDRLVGMLTDRDIVVRGLAAGKAPSALVRDVMTAEVRYCFEDEDLDEPAQNMGQLQVRRLPVLSREKRLVGVLSLADAALNYSPQVAGSALTAIVEPGGERSQHLGEAAARG
jgi:CBS domain-containing protein